jgi:hypothetical protein
MRPPFLSLRVPALACLWLHVIGAFGCNPASTPKEAPADGTPSSSAPSSGNPFTNPNPASSPQTVPSVQASAATDPATGDAQARTCKDTDEVAPTGDEASALRECCATQGWGDVTCRTAGCWAKGTAQKLRAHMAARGGECVKGGVSIPVPPPAASGGGGGGGAPESSNAPARAAPAAPAAPAVPAAAAPAEPAPASGGSGTGADTGDVQATPRGCMPKSSLGGHDLRNASIACKKLIGSAACATNSKCTYK